MADNEQHYFANDGSNWTTPPSPVSTKEAREADKALDDQAKEGDGPTATNDTELHRTIVEGSESHNPAEDNADDTDSE
jgi:hypothetical protein